MEPRTTYRKGRLDHRVAELVYIFVAAGVRLSFIFKGICWQCHAFGCCSVGHWKHHRDNCNHTRSPLLYTLVVRSINCSCTFQISVYSSRRHQNLVFLSHNSFVAWEGAKLRLRTSTTNSRVQRDRQVSRGKKGARELRICQAYVFGAVEDEAHVLLHCTPWAVLRFSFVQVFDRGRLRLDLRQVCEIVWMRLRGAIIFVTYE